MTGARLDQRAEPVLCKNVFTEFQLQQISEFSVLVTVGDRPDIELSRKVVNLFNVLKERADLPVLNFHLGYTSALLDFNPKEFDATEHLQRLSEIIRAADVEHSVEGRIVEIPVVYGSEYGPDLSDVAGLCGLSESEVVALHTSQRYFVAFIGFSPGFPYLLGLNNRLHVARKSVPRTRVSKGSVAIGGTQTGLYPTSTPGGWQIIGRTPMSLFDDDDLNKPKLRPGDQIEFKEITSYNLKPQPSHQIRSDFHKRESFGTLKKEFSDIAVREGPAYGRTHLGISPGGPADSVAHQLAQRLVGNDDSVGALEWSTGTFEIKFSRDTWVSLTGAACTAHLDQLPLSLWSSIPVAAGQVLTVTSSHSNLFSYLAVYGGITLAESGELTISLRGSALPRLRSVRKTFLEKHYGAKLKELSVTWGPQSSWFTDTCRKQFETGTFKVGQEVARSGIRVYSEAPAERKPEYADQELVSEGLVNGSIQVNPSGQTMILYCEQQTTGGYPKIATVVQADIFKLGQLRPGDVIRLNFVDLKIATTRYFELMNDLEAAIEQT